MDKNYYFVINDGQVVRVFEELEMTVSAGIAMIPYNGYTYKELFKNADKALCQDEYKE